jgi:hypothetical protein
MTTNTPDIRICQFFDMKSKQGNRFFKFQNYFVNQDKRYPSLQSGDLYQFAPFRAEGSVSSLNGENELLRVLFPNIDYALQLLHEADGNRLTRLNLYTMWLTSDNEYTTTVFPEFYIGIGSSISETTIELRFRSAIDSVAGNFPARTLTKELVGPLPLDSNITLQ